MSDRVRAKCEHPGFISQDAMPPLVWCGECGAPMSEAAVEAAESDSTWESYTAAYRANQRALKRLREMGLADGRA